MELLNIKQASEWATQYLGKNVSTSNISYLINYGIIRKNGQNGSILIDKNELLNYYDSFYGNRKENWKEQFGNDLNCHLSFEWLKEKETTKHVHRLHPYKGKFIPQLVEYFLDQHTDNFKRQVYFEKKDIVLDPFCGSGTTLVQANELGIHSIGIDISAFNSLISNVKLAKCDFIDLHNEIKRIENALKLFISENNYLQFDNELSDLLTKFNKFFFPAPDFRYKVRQKLINEIEYATEKEKEFLPIFQNLISKYNLKIVQDKNESFLEKWFLQPVKNEIDLVFSLIKQTKNAVTKKF